MPEERHYIRQENLRAAIGTMSQTDFAKYLSERMPLEKPMTKTFLSQLLQDLHRLDNGPVDGVRTVGDELARKIEKALRMKPGWLDSRHSEIEEETAEQSLEARLHKQGNDINALLYALGALVAVVSVKRQGEGELISQLLEKVADPKYIQYEGSVTAILDVVDTVTKAVKVGTSSPGRAKNRSAK